MPGGENIPGRNTDSDISTSGSPSSSRILNWIPRSFGDRSGAPPPSNPQRLRRDSSTLSADEALNISRANKSRPINISGAPKPIEEDNTSSDSSVSSHSHKYDKLGLITAFSGGPGSF